jgi:hypothetical protein
MRKPTAAAMPIPALAPAEREFEDDGVDNEEEVTDGVGDVVIVTGTGSAGELLLLGVGEVEVGFEMLDGAGVGVGVLLVV